jgi:hypothetical protein
MKGDGSYITCGILQDYEAQYDDVILYVLEMEKYL